MSLVIRSEVIEYGSLPLAPWLGQLDSLQAIRALLDTLHLRHLTAVNDRGQSFVTPQAISNALDITPVQTKILLDLLASVVEPADLVQRADGGDGILAVELYSLALCLFVHFYLREAAKAETSDVWPSEYFSWQVEPSSPMRMTARSWGRGAADASPTAAHRAHLPSMRQHLQQHLQLQEALVAGFGGFVACHAATLLALVRSPQQQAPSSPAASAGQAGAITAAEFNRLAFLLRPASTDRSRSMEGGSPMDVCSTPFNEGQAVSISEHTPFFAPGSGAAAAQLDAVAAWLADTLRPADESAGDTMMGSSPRSPQRNSVFNRLVQVSSLACPTDVHGASKATIVRGEDDFPTGRLRVLDCHDAVVYALAPLQYCLLTACSDCVVVLGAVGRVLRVERCERVQVIAAARCVTINTCHDCILYLGVNQQPLVLGDNRFVQLAPYSSGYERLPEHMALAAVQPQPNLWDQPLALLPDHTKHHHAHHQQQGGGGASPLASTQARAALPLALGSPESMQISQQQAAYSQQHFASPGSPSPSSLSEAATSAVAGGGSPVSTPVAAALGSPGVDRAAVGSPVPGTPASVTLLPPSKLVPFFIPFRGGPGPMCGGPARIAAAPRASSPRVRDAGPASAPASPSASGASPDSISSLFAVGEGSHGAFPPSPFELPHAYGAAWEERTRGAMEIKAAVKAANLDEGKKKELMAAIQAHFKDWLQSSGSMRQIYDLAKLERDESSSQLMNTL